MNETVNSIAIDHDAAEAGVQTFSFKSPETYTRRKAIVKLITTDKGAAAIHCLGQGGENNLHYHAGVDITWMVIKGRARFYGVGDVVRGGRLVPGPVPVHEPHAAHVVLLPPEEDDGDAPGGVPHLYVLAVLRVGDTIGEGD